MTAKKAHAGSSIFALINKSDRWSESIPINTYVAGICYDPLATKWAESKYGYPQLIEALSNSVGRKT